MEDIRAEVNRTCIVCDKYTGGDILCPECLAKAEAKGVTNVDLVKGRDERGC